MAALDPAIRELRREGDATTLSRRKWRGVAAERMEKVEVVEEAWLRKKKKRVVEFFDGRREWVREKEDE